MIRAFIHGPEVVEERKRKKSKIKKKKTFDDVHIIQDYKKNKTIVLQTRVTFKRKM